MSSRTPELPVTEPATPVDRITENLIKIVAREVEHLDRLLGLMTEQQVHLVQSDVPAVEENVRQQEQALQRLRELERERLRLLDQLSAHVPDDSEALTLSRLSTILSGTYAEQLDKLRGTLTSAAANIQRVRRQNELLIDRSMLHIRETMRLIAGRSDDGSSYAPRSAQNAGAGLINRLG